MGRLMDGHLETTMETQRGSRRVVRLEIRMDSLRGLMMEIQKACCLAFPLGLQMAWC